MKLTAITGMVLLALQASLFAQASAPATASAGPAKIVRFPHLTVDLTARQIVMEAVVCTREAPLEMLICKADTKEYESVMSTKAKAADLHAALLAMGLTPGRPARWSGADEHATFLPPQGPELSITLRWKDAEGKVHESAGSDWLKPAGQRKHAAPSKWIFIGSLLGQDGSYAADSSGEVASVSNFATAVIDVPFESSSNNDALEFTANTEAIPPVGTAVEVIVAPLPGAESSPYATRIVEIDQNGDILAGGRKTDIASLSTWATEYLMKHSKGYVKIRADGKATVADVAMVLGELWAGGVRDYDIERLAPSGLIPPRTQEQADLAIQRWKDAFDNPQELLVDPFEQADVVLKQIQVELLQIEAQRKILADYAQKLQAARQAKQAPTTKPAWQ